MKYTKYIVAFIILFSFSGCSVYNFSGAGKIDAKTFQVNYFQNISELIEPGIDRDFTNRLQDLIQNQTNLSLTNTDGDLLYDGEIVDYRIDPMTATADLTAAQSRLTITVNLRFTSKNKPEDNFEKRFSFYDDFDREKQLTGSQLKTSVDLIFARITQDIFNETLAKW
ncbi:MAG: LptE family protein [Flavobacterium sp.]